eukprot:TRINITY_DN10574_c0_g1_i2.p1 TRINITY_DN10574_c0_g1~~TRINITY_DN10574_c0_g1_i2.p1  ORF type:complete len:347 (+),score=63.34 TRINITY_DN10574_c0_g1_i2:42-1043(+)
MHLPLFVFVLTWKFSFSAAPEQDSERAPICFLQSAVTLARNGAAPQSGGFKSEVVESPVWPEPDDPNLRITSDHRRQVAAFKQAVKEQNVTKINMTVGNMALLPVQLDVEEGVYELIFQVLRDYQDDQYQWVQQWAWRGLSDQTGTEIGSEIITNVGGPNKGIEYMTKQILAKPPYYGYCADQLTVWYEILACMSGLLLNDNKKTRGSAAVEAGLVPAIIQVLSSEGDLIASAHTACRVMSFLFWRQPEYVAAFKDAGALPLVDAAIERFKDGDSTPFHFGFDMGTYYNISACVGPKALMEGDLLEWSLQKAEYIQVIREGKPWLPLEVGWWQ